MSSLAHDATAIAVDAPAPDRHFRTDHLIADIKGRSVRGGAVTLGAQAVKFVLTFGSTAVLARLLTPGDFGLIALVAAFTGFIALFNDLGLSMATVQRDEVTQEQVTALFWINVVLSIVLAALTAALAPLVAWMYGEPLLIGIMIAVACTFVFGGLTAQHTALLRRQMNFLALASIDVISMAAGIAAAVAAAWMGAGYWSLVILGAVTAGVNMALAWYNSPWRPSWPRRGSNVRSMVRFGGNLTAANLVNYFARNADNFLIGWYWGAGPLGLYSKAYGLLMLPLRQVNAPISAVAIPALSRVQNDPLLFSQYYCRTVRLIAFLTAPGIALLCALPREIIVLLLGAQWVDSARIFEVFAYASLLQPVTVTAGWLYLSLGNTRRMVWWSTANSVIAVCAFAAGLPWGAVGVAWATAGCMYVMFIPCMAVAMWKTPVRAADVVSSVWRAYMLASVIFAAAVAMRVYMQGSHPLATIIAASAAAAAAALALIAVWPALRRELLAVGGMLRHLRSTKAQVAAST